MIEAITIFLILFFALLLAVEIGYRVANRRSKSEDQPVERVSSIDGYIITLLTLLLAFGINSARDDFNARTALVLSEVQAIRLANIAFESLDSKTRNNSSFFLSQYIQTRRDYARTTNNEAQAKVFFEEGQKILGKLNVTLRANARNGKYEDATVDALAEVQRIQDKAVERQIALVTRHQKEPMTLLICFSLLAGVVLGRSLKGPRKAQHWERFVFAVMTATILTMILDYSIPRSGLIRIDAVDQAMETIQH